MMYNITEINRYCMMSPVCLVSNSSIYVQGIRVGIVSLIITPSDPLGRSVFTFLVIYAQNRHTLIQGQSTSPINCHLWNPHTHVRLLIQRDL